MANSPKIVMVGGGSYNWAPKLLCDLIQTEELNGSEVFLLDPNIKAAEEVEKAMTVLTRKINKKFRFISTDNEETAFKAADFVIITISTGGLEMMRRDLEIPERYGIFHTVGDSVGPAGWSRLLRNVPVFEKITRKIEKLSSNAVVLNYTNPMAGLTGTICKTTSLRTVGLCHGVFSVYNFIEKLFDVKEKDISIKFGGINHFFWVFDFFINNRPGYPMLFDKLHALSDFQIKTSDTDMHCSFKDGHLLFYEFLKEYGLMTYCEDRHTCEYFQAYLTNPEIMKRFNLKRTTISERYETVRKARKYTLKLASGKENIPKRSRESAVDIIKAFVTGDTFIDVVNLPNKGQIANLPEEAVVETLGVVNPIGFTPLTVGNVPESLRSILNIHCQVQKLTLEAALTGNKKLALEALSLDPLCSHLPPSEIRKMGNELIEATAEYLPQFGQ